MTSILELSSRLAYEEASQLSKRFGLALSRNLMNQLTDSYGKACQVEIKTKLEQAHEERLSAESNNALASQDSSRTMVLEIDGVYVLGQPEDGVCAGLELKTAVLYPLHSPSDRYMLADRCSSDDFLVQLSGLLKEANVSLNDKLIGLGDGALWIDKLFDHLKAIRITDVYHATEYLDVIMQEMNWDEQTRSQHRRAWCRGEVNAKDWLEAYLPEPDTWLSWTEKAQTALAYLENRLESMSYKDLKNQESPIGSGQIEGMNKACIGNRMKRSGMHWSEKGAKNMASLRAQTCAKHPLIEFQQLRFDAFQFSP